MGSKRKKRKVRKVLSATPVQEKSPKPQDSKTARQIIIEQGQLIESLISHEGWSIIEELIDEGIASVSGRKTNGYYYSGELTRGGKDKNYLTGYQEALTQLYNRVKDFIISKNKILNAKKKELEETKAPIINPFLEED
jgi:hypothetical protein